jgi:hypothetical protein
VRNGRQWESVETNFEPRLFVGWRPRARQLTGGRVELHADTFDDLRQVARDALRSLADAEAIAFDYEVLPTAGEEYIRRSLDDLPAVRSAEGSGESAEDFDDSAALVQLVRTCDDLQVVSAGQLANGDFALYGVVFPQSDGEMVGFVRAVNPARAMKKAALWGRHAGALRRMEPPDLMLESEVDLVITGDELAIIRRSAYDRMFSDLDELAAAVPANVTALVAGIPALPIARVRCRSSGRWVPS